ncbi:IS4 family transposase [Arthrobacter echini]|uniref:IS4 family transposase n=1 Tax=Arthrobacter echini TaxID=1529066 RepID=A0A4S5DZK9_9MICC|nr:IS4 family transposase [Arthrobacter echini]
MVGAVRETSGADGAFAPGHLGELTQIVPFEMVDAALAQTRTMQKRVRDLPSRVVVYLLLAGALFTEYGYRGIWAQMTAGLQGPDIATPSSGAMAQARRRLGPGPLRALFDLLRGPVPTGRGSDETWWQGRLVCAVDGTMMCLPETPANLTSYPKGTGPGATGYPMVRALALVACGTRSLIEVTFGPTSIGETTYTRRLIPALGERMILLADRNFAATDLIGQIAATGADLLIRVKTGRKLPVCRRLSDGSWISQIGSVPVRVIRSAITITTSDGHRTETYQLVTTVTDPDITATELVRLYHQRWEIETAFCELKHTILAGRVLRARTPGGIEQEIYALLITYQALRIAIADATLTRNDVDADRCSFTLALTAAREQLIKAEGVIADTVIDLIGTIGARVLQALMPARRPRISPRVVKRAISNYAPNTGKNRLRGPTYQTTISINILPDPSP